MAIKFGEVKTKSDVLEVLNQLHTRAMKECGAIDNPSKSSEALEVVENVLAYASSIKDNT